MTERDGERGEHFRPTADSAWHWARGHGERIAGWAHWLAFASSFAFLVVLNRRRWFDIDEWDALIRRSVLGGGGTRGLLEPHNEHLSLIPILLYRLLFSVFGLRTYVPYAVMIAIAHLIVAQLLWILLRRVGVDVWIALVAVTSFAFLGAGFDDLLFPWQVSFDVSVAAGLAVLLIMPAAVGSWSRRGVAVWGLLLVALASSGVGLAMLAVVGIAQLLRRGWLVAAATVSVPAVVYLAWYAAYDRGATAPGEEPFGTAIQKVPAFVWSGLTDPVSTTLGLAGAGVVVIILLGMWAARRARPFEEPWPLVLAMAAGAPIFLALTALRRVQIGIETAAASRYAYVVLLLLVPLAALAIDALTTRVPLRTVVVVAGLALLLLVGTTKLRRDNNTVTPREQDQKARILATALLTRRTSQFLSPVPVPNFISDLTTTVIRRLDRSGALPSDPVTPQERLNALEFVQVKFGPAVEAPAALGDALVLGVAGVSVSTDASSGCLALTATSDLPEVRMRISALVSLGLRPERTGQVTLQLHQGRAEGGVRVFSVVGGRPVSLAIDAPGTVAVVTVPAVGTTELCGARLGPAVSSAPG